ncbi:hypothetical protein ElyMa_003647300 [Elysia marginata]|uniref:Thioesterase domain-containing protein n=1 Tax=Elysia marginata TaxID=1093978 RepID=A0AAV4EW06_9GAST|nr:hypothetical protein ElyMa_003647300 [Elysia marginata]
MATHVQDYQLVLDPKRLKAETHFPGISYDDFDREGCISPWKLCRVFEAGRAMPFYTGNFADWNILMSDNTAAFVVGGEYYFDLCVWDAVRKFNNFPYKVTIEVINVGKSSLTFRQVLINKLDNKELATHYLKVVVVDKVTRRPKAVPSWHRDKYRHVEATLDKRAEFVINTELNVPGGAFQAETLVQPSDTDSNGHTNQASYVRFCLDAAECANRAGVLEYVQGDICIYPILKMSISYKGETKSGDRILTSVWQDKLSPQMLHFVSYCRGKIVLATSITFKSRPRNAVSKL